MEIDNYGELLSLAKDKPCVGFVMFGSYQGEWIGLLKAETGVELWKGDYGSCSGCDWIKSQCDDKITKKMAQDYFREETYFLLIPYSLIETMTEEDFKEIIPRNIREDIYEYSEGEKKLYNALKQVTE